MASKNLQNKNEFNLDKEINDDYDIDDTEDEVESIVSDELANDDDDDEDNDNDDEDNDDDDIAMDDVVNDDNIFTTNQSNQNLNTLIQSQDEDDDDDDDEDDDDETYLQKIDNNLTQQTISDYHPELKYHNYDEIINLSITTRDETGTIIDPLHRTIPIITKYEKTKILGERAKQINSGASPMIDVDKSIIDGYLIALKEYEAKKIPFIIKRPLPNGGCEYWKFEDLECLI
jgi:DNA-directed RNA polymerase subunit K/omega